MIVRAVLNNPELIDSLDLFNDARDTIGWLIAVDTTRSIRLADELQQKLDRYREQYFNPAIGTPFEL